MPNKITLVLQAEGSYPNLGIGLVYIFALFGWGSNTVVELTHCLPVSWAISRSQLNNNNIIIIVLQISSNLYSTE